ncbi:RNA recognition motif domain [Dillenia turbinata]|uniref:Small ribosomal subunit protein cS22 n=1 Tax=Dillenia turbinata TaxID=194707 RepID=A0AAN8VBS8_9MAGN
MATVSSSTSPILLQNPRKHLTTVSLHPSNISLTLVQSQNPRTLLNSNPKRQTERPRVRTLVVAEKASSLATLDPSSESARRLYVGNIPRTVDNTELRKIVGEHGEVEKAEVMYDKYSGRSRRFAFVTMKTIEDANAAIVNLNGKQIGGQEIKVNITEKPLQPVDFSAFQAEDSQFIDSPHKVYVGNLPKTVTSKSLSKFFSEKGKVLSAKVSRVPGSSKSNGFGFVTFSSDEDVEAAISSFNNTFLEGQRIRVNKA